MKCTNDIYSDDFESKLDPYFTSGYVEAAYTRYSRFDKNDARSALATKRPRAHSRHWGNAPLGMRMIRNEPQKTVS